MESILEFLNKKKEAWLEKQSKKEGYDADACLIESKSKFTVEAWVLDNYSKATQVRISSHPSKFSGSNVGMLGIVAKNRPFATDGLIRSGNVTYPLDAYGNATALDVIDFLNLPVATADGSESILSHLVRDSSEVKSILNIPEDLYDTVRDTLLTVMSPATKKEGAMPKQVYFPVSDTEYHLLSVLTPSGIMYSVREKLDELIGSGSKEARENRRNNKHDPVGFKSVPDQTIISYGGANAQNVSRINAKFGGKAKLLNSCPPSLTKRKVRLPSYDFFKQTLYAPTFKEEFNDLHRYFMVSVNNAKIRAGIASLIEHIVSKIDAIASKVRIEDIGWTAKATYAQLPGHQKEWLDPAHSPETSYSKECLEKIAIDVARWIVLGYGKQLGDKSASMSDYELTHVASIVKTHLTSTKG